MANPDPGMSGSPARGSTRTMGSDSAEHVFGSRHAVATRTVLMTRTMKNRGIFISGFLRGRTGTLVARRALGSTSVDRTTRVLAAGFAFRASNCQSRASFAGDRAKRGGNESTPRFDAVKTL